MGPHHDRAVRSRRRDAAGARRRRRPCRRIPSAALEHTERRARSVARVSALPREQREVLLLKEYEGLKFREIADVLGVAESTVKSRMYAGLDAMRMSLASLGIH